MQHPDDSAVLRDIYRIMVEWVRFADQKIAMLLALHGALLLMVMRGLSDNFVFGLLQTIIVIIVLAACIMLLNAMRPRMLKLHIYQKGLNLLSYRDICDISTSDYIALLQAGKVIDEPNQLVVDLTNQIIINAKVATVKYRWINRVVRFDLVAVTTTAVYIIAHDLVSFFK